jgi:hypothetical protein
LPEPSNARLHCPLVEGWTSATDPPIRALNGAAHQSSGRRAPTWMSGRSARDRLRSVAVGIDAVGLVVDLDGGGDRQPHCSTRLGRGGGTNVGFWICATLRSPTGRPNWRARGAPFRSRVRQLVGLRRGVSTTLPLSPPTSTIRYASEAKLSGKTRAMRVRSFPAAVALTTCSSTSWSERIR